MAEISPAQRNVLASLLDLTKRTDPPEDLSCSFSARTVYEHARAGKSYGERIFSLWGKKDELRTERQAQDELNWVARQGYSEANLVLDGKNYILGYRIKKEKILEVEKMLERGSA